MLRFRRRFQVKTRIFFFTFLLVVGLSILSELTHHNEKAHEGNPVFAHIADSHVLKLPFTNIELPQFEPVTIGGITLNFSPTKHLMLFWSAAFLMMLLLGYFYNRKEIVQKNFIAFILEDLIIFIRDNVVKPAFPNDYQKYSGYFLSFFFFILINNYLGLIPLMSTATGNISITAALALSGLIFQNAASLFINGPIGYFKQFTPISGMGKISGFLMNLFMFPIEIFSMLIRPFSLAVRLYANMLAGHAMVLSVLFIGYSFKTETWNYYTMLPITIIVVGMGLLEILVCFLQAYVFTMLSCIFLSSALNHEH